MEFQGRISRVLEARSGVSQRTGNEWKAQSFVFEYYENETDRYPDSVVLETFDTNVIPHIKEGLEVCIGFYHKVHEYQGKLYNELRPYKIESVKNWQQSAADASVKNWQQSAAADAAGTVATQQPAPQPQATNPEYDDLPF